MDDYVIIEHKERRITLWGLKEAIAGLSNEMLVRMEGDLQAVIQYYNAGEKQKRDQDYHAGNPWSRY